MIIGLTGGIATGKSNVSRFLARHGYRVVDADQVAHRVQQRGSAGLRAIISHFGSGYLNADRTLNRRKLGRRVFSDPQALRDLVRVVDPDLRSRIVAELKRDCSQTKRVVLDAPTLFENGYQYLVDRIVVVACEPNVQLARLRDRDQLSIEVAEKRISSQWPLRIKAELADVVINSNGSKRQTLRQVSALIDQHRI